VAELHEVRVPDVGEADEVEVIEILVAKGDRVEVDDPIVTLESDKATMELPSPAAGVVDRIAVSVGDAVEEGTLLLVLRLGEAREGEPAESQEGPPEGEPAERGPERAAPPAAEAGPPDHAAPAAGREAASADAAPAEAPSAERAEAASAPASRRPAPAVPPGPGAAPPPHASPLVRRMARELGVDLRGKEGSGPAGRILTEDVRETVRAAMSRGGAPQGVPAAGEAADFGRYGEVEEVALSKIRRVSARNLAQSWAEIPQVTQHDDADVTELEALRKRYAPRLAEEGVRLSPLLFVMKACAIALRAFPDMRSSRAEGGESLVVKHYYHLGVAVDTENGLVVPVVRDVDRKGIRELAVEVAALAERARSRRLQPADFEGAVFTISSLGGIGGTSFTPIVNRPQVAILGLSRTRMQPVWNAGSGSFEPRQVLPLSLSYDHRVIDGAEAVRFTTELVRLLSDPGNLLL